MAIGTGTIAAAATLALGAAGVMGGSALLVEEGKEGKQAAPQRLSQDTQLERKVTGSFRDATLGEVLKWLTVEGLSFVADSSTLAGTDMRLTANILDRPLKDVLDAIAEAFGGKWTRHGNVYSFSRSKTHFFEGGSFDKNLDMKELPADIELHLKKLGEEMKGKGFIEFSIPDIAEMKGFELDPQDLEELKALREHLKAIPMPDLEELKGLKEHLKSMPDMKALEIELKGLKDLVKPGMIRFGGTNVPALIEGLTPAQLEKQQKLGYLTPADLTPAQLQMLGDLPKGEDWSLSFKIDGRTLNLKSK